MSGDIEIRDPAEARLFLAQGLWLQRVARPSAATVPSALDWAAELAGGGEPIPPVGFVADVGNLALDGGRTGGPGGAGPEVPGWPAGLARLYEDAALGRLDADGSMGRASAALARYRGRDRSRGLAFLLGAVRRRAGLPGALLNPAAIKAAREVPPEILLADGWEALARSGPLSALADLQARLVAALREMPEALGPEDVFELESRTALMPFADRVAIRQVVRAASDLEAGVTLDRPRLASRHDVATEVADEDTYPTGGYSSISTRGSIESLLYSQLAYMEPAERPDLFDIKYARDELLYYARDENRFLRRRHAYQIVLDPSLALGRVKDPVLPYQRVVLGLALLVAAVRVLTRWLGGDALAFEFLFPRDGAADPLAPERSLLAMALRDGVANGTVLCEALAADRLPSRLAAPARGARCRRLLVVGGDRPVGSEMPPGPVLRIGGDRPALEPPGELPDAASAADGLPAWGVALDALLAGWTSDDAERAGSSRPTH